MLIQPDTYIRLIKNCPLDNTYDHTIYFEDEASQIQYFKNTLVGIPFTKQSYQRYDKGVLHIQEKAENLYECNYLMFQNSAFGNKWFYAFITSIEYVNNVSSRVYYELDVMQTWFFNYTVGDCFVEREHPLTDNIGENLVPENLELGEYICTSQSLVDEIRELSIVVASTMTVEDDRLNLKPGDIYSLVYSGLFFNVFPATDAGVEAVKAFISLDTLLPGGSSIVSIFMMPSVFVSNNAIPKFIDKTVSKEYGNFGEFTPNNNKLYTYPYNFLYVTNLQGGEAVYNYEYFDSENCVFYLGGDTSCNPGVMLTPTNYKGVSRNYDESLTLTGFPQCAYTDDAFAAYLSQLASASSLASIRKGVASSVAGASTSVASGLVSGPIGGVGAVLGVLAQNAPTLISPRESRGVSNNATLVANTALNFFFMKKRITEEFARIIDGFFDVYGYACRKVKKPNVGTRPHWNYVKTRNCVLHGSVPADDMSRLHSIYDKGVTFWKNGADVGNYSLDNKPV